MTLSSFGRQYGYSVHLRSQVFDVSRLKFWERIIFFFWSSLQQTIFNNKLINQKTLKESCTLVYVSILASIAWNCKCWTIYGGIHILELWLSEVTPGQFLKLILNMPTVFFYQLCFLRFGLKQSSVRFHLFFLTLHTNIKKVHQISKLELIGRKNAYLESAPKIDLH